MSLQAVGETVARSPERSGHCAEVATWGTERLRTDPDLENANFCACLTENLAK